MSKLATILVIGGLGIAGVLIYNNSQKTEDPISSMLGSSSSLGGDGFGSGNDTPNVSYNFNLASDNPFGVQQGEMSVAPTSKKSSSSSNKNLASARGLGYTEKNGVTSFIQSSSSGPKVVGGETSNMSIGSAQGVKQAEASAVLLGKTKKDTSVK